MVAPRQTRMWIFRLLVCGLFGLGFIGTASAGLVSTKEAIQATQTSQARAQLKALLQRPELAAELKALGASPAEAQARVDAMTDKEVMALAGKVADLPAGGYLSHNELILLLIIILILVI